MAALLLGCEPEQFERVTEDLSQRLSDQIIQCNPGDASKPCIAIVSHSTLDVKYLDLAKDVHQRYARKFGYDYILRNNLLTEQFIDRFASSKVFQLGLYWQKIFAVQAAFEERDARSHDPEKRRYGWVMWVDADALFTNFTIPLEEITAKHPGKSFLVSREPYMKINAGIFLLKNDPWSREMLATVARSYAYYRNHNQPEQEALQDYIFGFIGKDGRGELSYTPVEQKYYDPSLVAKEAIILPQRHLTAFYPGSGMITLFAYGEDVVWEPGDFIEHFAIADQKHKAIKALTDCFKEKGGDSYENNQTAIQECR